MIDSILNRTLIYERTNKIISNKNPSVYLKNIMTEQKIDDIIAAVNQWS